MKNKIKASKLFSSHLKDGWKYAHSIRRNNKLENWRFKKIENFKKDHNFEKACKAVPFFFQQTN
jgi:hypothetical protein